MRWKTFISTLTSMTLIFAIEKLGAQQLSNMERLSETRSRLYQEQVSEAEAFFRLRSMNRRAKADAELERQQIVRERLEKEQEHAKYLHDLNASKVRRGGIRPVEFERNPPVDLRELNACPSALRRPQMDSLREQLQKAWPRLCISDSEETARAEIEGVIRQLRLELRKSAQEVGSLEYCQAKQFLDSLERCLFEHSINTRTEPMKNEI